jgi:hypothetical protein
LPIRGRPYMSSPHGATWRSGYATVCKTVYSGSIPDVASTFEINGLGPRFGIGFQAAEGVRGHPAATRSYGVLTPVVQ